jgi:flagellar hook assembly protein FlgD
MPSETETLTDSTATNPYVLGGEPYGVRFNLARAGAVSIRVYDVTGRLVRTVFDDHLAAGFDHRKEWDGENEEGRTVAPGVYLIRFETEGYGMTRKVVVLR